MAMVYYKGDKNTYMDVMPGDVSYWSGQGWSTTVAGAPSSSSAPTGTQYRPDPSSRFYLVSFKADPTPNDAETGTSMPWLYDTTDHTFRPFKDQGSLETFITASGGDPVTAMGNITQLNPEDITGSGSWAGTFLSTQYTPDQNGKLPAYNAGPGATGAAGGMYGGTKDANAEQLSVKALSYLLIPRWTDLGILSQDSVNLLKTDPGVLQKYVYAMTYGGYLPQDIWRDLKIIELAKTDPAYTTMHGVSPTLSAADFYKSKDYQTVLADQKLMPPAVTLDNGTDLMKYPVYKMPDSFYQELAPTIDWQDPKFKAEADKIAAGFYDVLLAKTEAQSAHDKQIADDNYNRFVDSVNTRYNLNLSNNAEQAWRQIQSLKSTYENRGVGNSGLLQEAIDKTLLDRRKQLDLTRSEHIKTTDVNLRNFLLSSASSQQVQDAIAKMNTEDKAAGLSPDNFRATLWGLSPSEEVSNQYSLENLQKAYPDYTPEQIKTMRDSFIDENGNYRSRFFQTAISNKLSNLVNKQTYQGQKQMQNSATAAKQAGSAFVDEFGGYIDKNSDALSKAQADKTASDQNATGSAAGSAPPVIAPGSTIGNAQPVSGAGSAAPATGWKPPTGYEIINGAQYNTTATQRAAYDHIQTSPDKKNLYGIRKTSGAATPVETPDKSSTTMVPGGTPTGNTTPITIKYAANPSQTMPVLQSDYDSYYSKNGWTK